MTGRGPEGPGESDGPDQRAAGPGAAVRIRAQSKRLRQRLARVAEQVAEVEEQCAAIHDAMAAHVGPVVDAAERAARARRFAAVERATARAYRRGVAPPDVAWATLRQG